jgi:hypothetical protein
MFKKWCYIILLFNNGTPPNSMKYLNASLRLRITKKKNQIGAHSLVPNTFGVAGHVRTLGWD